MLRIAYPQFIHYEFYVPIDEKRTRYVGVMVQFKKGAVCAIDVDGATPGGPGTLRWLLTPRALRALAP